MSIQSKRNPVFQHRAACCATMRCRTHTYMRTRALIVAIVHLHNRSYAIAAPRALVFA